MSEEKTSTSVEVAKVVLPTELEQLKEATALKTGCDTSDILVGFAPFFPAIAEIKKDFEKINFENPTALDSEIADKCRKRIVKIRTASEKVKDDNNRDYLLYQRISTSANNLVNSICKIEENKLNEVAKFQEIQEAKRQEALKEERRGLLLPYGFAQDDVDGLEKMSVEVWDMFLAGAKKSYDDRVETARKAEEERVAKEKKEAQEKEAMRLQNEALQKEKDAIQAKADAERKAAEEEAKRVKAESDAKLKAEKEKADKLAAAIQAKADAERKAAEEEKKKKAAEETAAKKAAKAPDKEKLKSLIASMTKDIEVKMDAMELKTEEAKSVNMEIIQKYNGFIKWALSQIETL